MKKAPRIAASELQTGMTFDMFKSNCFTIDAKKNRLGKIVVRFVTDTDEETEISHIVVAPTFLFKARKK